MKAKNDKPCKRKKCPHYKEKFIFCAVCEWNPNGVWLKDKKHTEFQKNSEKEVE